MDAKTNRRLQLLRIIETRFHGKSGKCADFLGIKRTQMSRWITENEAARQGIAEGSARSIERKLGIQTGIMDTGIEQPHRGVLAPDISDLASSWALLLPDEQSSLLVEIQRRAAHNKAVGEMLAAKPSATSKRPATAVSATPPKDAGSHAKKTVKWGNEKSK